MVKTNYRKSGAGALVRYISSRGRLYDRSGMEIDYPEDFVDRSEELEFERMVILSPGRDLSDRDMGIYARKQLESQFRDCPTADYVYSIHRETEHPHVMVALTGERRDLYLDRTDLERMRDREREVLRDLGYERELDRYRGVEYDYGL